MGNGKNPARGLKNGSKSSKLDARRYLKAEFPERFGPKPMLGKIATRAHASEHNNSKNQFLLCLAALHEHTQLLGL